MTVCDVKDCGNGLPACLSAVHGVENAVYGALSQKE